MYLIFDNNGNLIQKSNEVVEDEILDNLVNRLSSEIGITVIGTNNESICKKSQTLGYFSGVIENGIVIDVIPSIQNIIGELKLKKIIEIKLQCNEIILSGFDFNNEHYNFDYEDQINMEAIKNNFLLGLFEEYEYYPAGKPCRVYSKQEFVEGVYATGMAFKTANIKRCKELIEDVEHSTTEEEIANIKW